MKKFFGCHITQLSTAEKAGIARGLLESAIGGRVSQRPIFSRSARAARIAGPAMKWRVLGCLFRRFAAGSFLHPKKQGIKANCQSSAVLYADKNEHRIKRNFN